MKRSCFRILVAAVTAALLGACASGGTQGKRTTRVIDTNAGVRETDNTLVSKTTTVHASPDATLDALAAAYTDLGIEVKLRDPRTGEVGNRNFAKMYRLAGEPLSAFVGCGLTTMGQAADNYRVTMSIVSRVTPDGSGSHVETLLTAYAEDISSSKGTLSCETRGTLEERIHELAIRHAGS